MKLRISLYELRAGRTGLYRMQTDSANHITVQPVANGRAISNAVKFEGTTIDGSGKSPLVQSVELDPHITATDIDSIALGIRAATSRTRYAVTAAVVTDRGAVIRQLDVLRGGYGK